MNSDPYLFDLAVSVEREVTSLPFAGRPETDEDLLGSIVLDPRNFDFPGTTRSLALRGLIEKFGSKMQGVQYYRLSLAGLCRLRVEYPDRLRAA